MAKLTYFDSDWTNEIMNPGFSQWVQEVKDEKLKATCTVCKKTFSLSNMVSTALKSHWKSEKQEKYCFCEWQIDKDNQCICQYLEISINLIIPSI